MLLTEALPLLIERKKPFVVFRLPKSDTPITLTQGDFRQEMPKDQSIPYFVTAPFVQDQGLTTSYYYPQKTEEGWDIEPLEAFTDPIEASPITQTPTIVSQQAYLASAERLIHDMKAGKAKKVVLSRVIEKKLPETFHVGKAFAQLCQEHPNAFVYIYLNAGQLWMGATPETLLEATDNQAKTMALAGTQKARDICPTKYSWAEKELEEHDIVREYIFHILHQLKVDHLRQHQPTSLVAGKMVHLRTVFEFEIPDGSHPVTVAQSLHPTPAICGFPTEKALNLIEREEVHNRTYYTGFLGPSDAKESRFFVNLRCMQLIGEKAYVYVGGGLTAASDPEKEWEETVLKAGTMLSVIQNNS